MRHAAGLAKAHSLCPSRSAGGRIGWVHPGSADAAIEAAVLDKPVGHVAQAHSSAGHHLIEVLQERAALSGNAADAGGADGHGQPAPQQPEILSTRVQELAAVMQDDAKVCSPRRGILPWCNGSYVRVQGTLSSTCLPRLHELCARPGLTAVALFVEVHA